MRRPLFERVIIIVAATTLALAMTVFSFSQQPPPAQAGAARGGAPPGGGRGGGGRGGARGAGAPAEPTPRLPDRTVNLGRTPADVDGMWSLPYIQSPGLCPVFPGCCSTAGWSCRRRRGGGGGRAGGGAAAGGRGPAQAAAPRAGRSSSRCDPNWQQPRMPTPVAVAAVGVEVAAQPVAEVARHPSRGFLSCPGLRRCTTTIQRTSPSTTRRILPASRWTSTLCNSLPHGRSPTT